MRTTKEHRAKPFWRERERERDREEEKQREEEREREKERAVPVMRPSTFYSISFRGLKTTGIYCVLHKNGKRYSRSEY